MPSTPPSAPSAAAPVSSSSFGPSPGGPTYQSALAGGSGLELAAEPAPASSFDAAAPFAPTASFEPAAVGTAFAPASENPYQAPRARVDRPLVQASDPLADMVLARRFTRLAAAILDGVLVLIPVFLGFAFSGDFERFIREEPSEIEVTVLTLKMMFTWGLPVIAMNIYLLARSGQSLGKKALGIKIVRTDGSQASLARLLMLRVGLTNVVGQIPILGNLFGLLDALFIFGEERRCIHDHFADTMVVVA